MIKKHLLAFLLTSVLSLNASAFMLEEGTNELGVSGILDLDSSDGTLFGVNLKLGRFVQYATLMGLEVDLRDSDSISVLGGSLFGELNYPTDSFFVPFVGASVGGAFADVNPSGSEIALIFGVEGGTKLYLAENVAASIQLSVDVATSDIYPEDDGAGSIETQITLGLRYFFP